MSKREWLVTTHVTGQPREIKIALYDSPSAMRRAATIFAKNIGEVGVKPGHFKNALAVTHSYYLVDADDDAEKQLEEVCTVRFCKGELTEEIIAHEAVHVAQWLYRIDLLGEESEDLALYHFHGANEAFAHLVSGLFRTFTEVLSE